MHAFQIWASLSQPLQHEILESSYFNQKKLYRMLVQDMSEVLRKRPILLQALPRKERHMLFQPLLGLPNYQVLTQNLLMQWLVSDQSKMMAAFLEGLGIEHDGKGCVDSFPDEIDQAKLKTAVEKLYTEFPEEKVTVYLRSFDTLSGANWPSLTPLIRESAVSEPARA